MSHQKNHVTKESIKPTLENIVNNAKSLYKNNLNVERVIPGEEYSFLMAVGIPGTLLDSWYITEKKKRFGLIPQSKNVLSVDELYIPQKDKGGEYSQKLSITFEDDKIKSIAKPILDEFAKRNGVEIKYN